MTQLIPPNYGIIDGTAFYVNEVVPAGGRLPQVKQYVAHAYLFSIPFFIFLLFTPLASPHPDCYDPFCNFFCCRSSVSVYIARPSPTPMEVSTSGDASRFKSSSPVEGVAAN